MDSGRSGESPCEVVSKEQDNEALPEDREEARREHCDSSSSEEAPSGDLPHAEE